MKYLAANMRQNFLMGFFQEVENNFLCHLRSSIKFSHANAMWVATFFSLAIALKLRKSFSFEFMQLEKYFAAFTRT